MARIDVEQPTFEDLELLAEVSQLLTLLDLDNVLQKVIKLTARAVGASRASLFLHEGQEVDWDHIFVTRDLSPDESVRVVTRVLDEGLAGWVKRHKQGAIVDDTETDNRWIVFPDDTLPVRSALCVPFLYNERVLAVATLVHPEPHHFTDYHLRLITIIANQATVAIRNAQLFNHIEAQQRQLEAFLQAIPDVLLILDENGYILMVNDAARWLLDEVETGVDLRGHISDLVATDYVFGPIETIINTPHEETRWLFEARSERRQKDFHVTMSVWRDARQEVGGYVVVMYDITTLRDLSRFKDEMLRVASHDLRSPLALIVGYADMIALDTPDPESPIHEYLSVIRGSTERMSGLLEDLLRVERIRTSPLELHEETDISKLVKVVLVNMRLSAVAKHQQFDTSIALDDVPSMVVDPVLVRQAMENLIGNAIKYTPEGGTITVRAYQKNDRFYFEVEDTGIGIAREHLSHVFESFFRVPEHAPEEKGSGLGLSLVKNVVERHNGEIWVDSEKGQGSRFGFWLPFKREDT